MLCSLLLSTCARRARARDPRAPHRALHERRFEHHVSIDVSKAARHLRPHARHRAACKRALGERCASGRADAFQAWRGVWQPHNERPERLGRPRPAHRPSGVYNQHPEGPRMNPQGARPAPGAPCARWRSGCRPHWTTAAPAATRRRSCRGRATPHCCARARSFAFVVQHKRCTAQINIIESTCALHSRRPAGKPMQTTSAHKSSGDIRATELPYQNICHDIRCKCAWRHRRHPCCRARGDLDQRAPKGASTGSPARRWAARAAPVKRRVERLRVEEAEGAGHVLAQAAQHHVAARDDRHGVGRHLVPALLRPPAHTSRGRRIQADLLRRARPGPSAP